ncbi:MAG: DUF1579 family protein [Verrucomicrobiia bacterium]
MQTQYAQQPSSKARLIVVTSLLLLWPGIVLAQIQDLPKAGPAQRQMEVHVGQWQQQGTVNETPFGPAGTFKGRTTCKMILDDLFLESRAEDHGVFNGKELILKTLSVQWYDPSTKTYSVQEFDSHGWVTSSTVTVNGDTWTDTGTMIDGTGKSYKIRTTLTFSPDGKKCVRKAEISADDGKTWIIWWELSGEKIAD